LRPAPRASASSSRSERSRRTSSGKRALRKGPKTTLEIALMADGVAPKDVYKTLGTNEGVERAFDIRLGPECDLVNCSFDDPAPAWMDAAL